MVGIDMVGDEVSPGPATASVQDVLKALPDVSLIDDSVMREKVIQVYLRAMQLAQITDLDTVPFTRTFKTSVPYPVHIRAVTRMAIGIGKMIGGQGIQVDMDVLIAGALLHDVGKLLEYCEGPGPCSGPMVKHTFSGAALAQDAGLPPSVLHCMIYHSIEGRGRRRTTEAIIVHHCDLIHFEADRSVEEVDRGRKRG
jgi:putative nucleotidyltransferase with HDIG domain